MNPDRPRPLTSLDTDRILAGRQAYDDGRPYDPHMDDHWQAGWLARSAQRGDNRAPFVNPARPPVGPAEAQRPRPACAFEATLARILGRAAQTLGRLGRADLAREALDQGLRVADLLGPHDPMTAASLVRFSAPALDPEPSTTKH
jgi:hypothetical protein